MGAGAVTVGSLTGIVLFLALPFFQQYVNGVMELLGALRVIDQHAPGIVLAMGAAFLVGLSMNFLPCNLPIVMSLLPATTGADSRRAVLRRTGLYGLGAVGVLGTIGALLGALGATVKPMIVAYAGMGVYVAGSVIGFVGLLSVLWGLRELGLIGLPTVSVPVMNALRTEVDAHTGATEYVLLGAVYGGTGGGCPMPTYQLLLVWIVVAADAAFGALLLGTYVLGRVLPIAVLGVTVRDPPNRVAKWFRGRYETLRAVNGVVLLAGGSLLMVFVGLRMLSGGG